MIILLYLFTISPGQGALKVIKQSNYPWSGDI